MTSLRILHVSSVLASDFVGGAELFVRDLARTQQNLGHTVAVAGVSRSKSETRDEAGVPTIGLGYAGPFYFRDWAEKPRWQRKLYKFALQVDRGFTRGLVDTIERFRPDIVNTHSLSELPPLIWPAIRKTQTPIVHTLHDFTSMCSNGALFHDGHVCDGHRTVCRAMTRLHRACDDGVQAVAAVGADVLDRHLEAGFFRNVPQDRRAVVWNMIDPPEQASPRAPGKHVRLGYLGRIEPAKGPDLLIEACRSLPPSGWSLTVGGSAPDGIEPYRALAAGMPITFPGRLDADAFYAGIDCLIVPSLWPEAFGRTVAEALLRGVPVIGSDTGGIREQLAAWGCGILFPPGDTAALAAILADIVSGTRPVPVVPERPDIAARLDATQIAEQMLDLYSRTLAGSSHRQRFPARAA